MYTLTNPSPRIILSHILTVHESTKYTYIILGKCGPTGKTWLYTQLRSRGFNVFEITEDVASVGMTVEGSNSNQFIVNEQFKQITIILNRPLNEVLL